MTFVAFKLKGIIYFTHCLILNKNNGKFKNSLIKSNCIPTYIYIICFICFRIKMRENKNGEEIKITQKSSASGMINIAIFFYLFALC